MVDRVTSANHEPIRAGEKTIGDLRITGQIHPMGFTSIKPRGASRRRFWLSLVPKDRFDPLVPLLVAWRSEVRANYLTYDGYAIAQGAIRKLIDQSAGIEIEDARRRIRIPREHRHEFLAVREP